MQYNSQFLRIYVSTRYEFFQLQLHYLMSLVQLRAEAHLVCNKLLN